MALPEPEPGLVFRYDYVWAREARRGDTTGKERPACVAVATDSDIDPRLVLILPISHSRPTGKDVGVEIPAAVRRQLGLDDEPCWVIVSDSNVDDWPNPGITPLPGKSGVFAYGMLPPRLFERIKIALLACGGGKRTVRR